MISFTKLVGGKSNYRLIRWRGVQIQSVFAWDGWPDCQERNAFKPHCIHTITIRKAFVVITARRGGLGCCYKETALSQEEGKASSQKHLTQSTEDDLKLFLRILSIFTYIISSLINTCDCALYVWTLLHTCRVRSSTDCRVCQQSS